MEDYKKMYFSLFNKITDVIEELQQIQKAAEDMYIYHDELKKIDLNAKDYVIDL